MLFWTFIIATIVISLLAVAIGTLVVTQLREGYAKTCSDACGANPPDFLNAEDCVENCRHCRRASQGACSGGSWQE